MVLLGEKQELVPEKRVSVLMRWLTGGNTLCRMGENLRTESREERMLAMRVDGAVDAITRNISTTGVFFESSVEQTVGSMIDFTIDFDSPGGPLHVRCKGIVVRTEVHGQRVGVAVQIIESKFVDGRSDFGALQARTRRHATT
jgi:hypothetical protein